MKLIRYILFPFALLYGVVIRLRHWCYDCGIFRSVSFDIPTICVGNVSVGGTGKTPMVEYLIRQLRGTHKVGVLSRGYKRQRKGFVLADESSTVYDLGDEPFQFWRKFPEIRLAVDANRVEGIERLIVLDNPPDIVILDDAFQHRKVKAKINIVLTAYGHLFSDDWLLPTGNLRDIVARVRVADVVVVTKCPEELSEKERARITKKLQQRKDQIVVFAEIAYGKEVLSKEAHYPLDTFLEKTFTLVTGIANPAPLVHFLQEKKAQFKHLQFADHHTFSKDEISKLEKEERILTTEKDFVRLEGQLNNVYSLPIEMKFLTERDQKMFGTVFDGL